MKTRKLSKRKGRMKEKEERGEEGWEKISVSKDMEKLEPLSIAGKNIK
jgi:hypothetical protein